MTDDAPAVGDVDTSGKTAPGELHLEIGKRPATEAKPLAEGGGSGPETGGNAPDKRALLTEAYRRGILPSDKKALYEEAQRRGLFNGAAASAVPAETRDGFTAVTSDLAGDISKVATGAIGTAQRRLSAAEQQIRKIRGMAPDVDYDTGASVLAQVKVKDADNPQEARLALEHLYGPGNAGQDKGGRWWVRIDGRKTAVFGGGGGIGTGLREGTAGLAASAPEAAGAITGALVGAPAGPLGMVIGAGIGGAGGKGLDEFRKWLQGETAKTPGQETTSIATSALVNAAGEGAGQLVGAAGQRIGRFIKNYVGVTPESAATTRRLLGPGPYRFWRQAPGNARPPIETYAPKATAFQYDVMLRNLVAGDPQRARNLKFAMQRLHDILFLGGLPDDEIDEVFASIIDPRRAVSTREEGELVANAVRDHLDSLEREADQSLKTARDIAERQARELKSVGNSEAADSIHRRFVESAQLERRRWGAAMQRGYDAIDEMVEGGAIVPTSGMAKAAKAVLEFLPSSNTPTIFHEIAGLHGNVSIKQAQRYRTRLFEQADSGNLTPGTVEHDYNEVAKSVDAALDPANPAIPEGLPKQALDALAKQDAEYAQGIAKFRDARLNQMIRDFRNQKVLDPEKFAAALFDTRSTFRVNSYRQIVGEDTWRAVQAADVRNMLKTALKQTAEGDESRRISGTALDNLIHTRGEMLDAIHGRDVAEQWRLYAARLRALDGKLSIFTDPYSDPSRFTEHLARSVANRERLDSFARNDALRMLRRGGPEEVDAAINAIIQPGQEAQLEHIIKFFTEQSPQVAAIRRAAIKKALQGTIRSDTTGVQRQVDGKSIDAFLSRYTRREQEMLFPNGMDRDLRIIADDMKALFPTSREDMGGSLAAANIKGKIPISLAADIKWVIVKFKGWLADRPRLIAAVGGLSQPDTATRQIRRAALRVLFRQFLNEQGQARASTAQTPPSRAGRR